MPAEERYKSGLEPNINIRVGTTDVHVDEANYPPTPPPPPLQPPPPILLKPPP